MMSARLRRTRDYDFLVAREGLVMRFGTGRNRAMVVAGLTAFFAVLAVNLMVPIVMVSVMGLVDRALMRIWFGLLPALMKETAA
jgi:hypothetical protein